MARHGAAARVWVLRNTPADNLPGPRSQMRITRLPRSLVRREHGMVKDHVILLNEDSATPLAWRVNASFAGYLAGKMAALVSDPGAVCELERRGGAARPI